MRSSAIALEARTLGRVARALEGVPRAAYSVPHVYPSAAPAYVTSPKVERPHPESDQLRLYVHVPYCRYHCTFCYFAVRVGASPDAMTRYVRALERELEWVAPGTPLSQLFVGGGTPTALPADLLERVLESIFARTTPGGGVHTVETSPETISPAHVDVLRRRGIGRISMGIQSLDGDVLSAVHRRQTRAQALAACELLVDSGLIMNVDLIYGLPGQTEAGFLADLRAVAACGVPSLTLYSLRVNERTPVGKTLGDEPFDLAGLARWRAFVKRSAEELGYTQTRWHTFKRLDTIARRHERLPCFDEAMSGYQLGIGTSARSHLGYTVYRNHERLEEYVDRVERGESPVEQTFVLDEADRMTQFVARTLGDGKSLARADWRRTFGRPIERDFGDLLARLGAADLIDDDGATLALSPVGELLHDLVTLAFYPARARAWLAAREGRAAFVRAEPAA
ncbi:MAG TPA: coproporphyrinogen-III oxidase family protein, partial [Candidatus Binatia bacterium]|nr:coproporphyrinogen-III oxidase family protein [Candidatus Binatia bacterium]